MQYHDIKTVTNDKVAVERLTMAKMKLLELNYKNRLREYFPNLWAEQNDACKV